MDGWARLGIPAIGVWRDKLEEYGVARGIKRVRDAGLKVSSYHGVGGPYRPGEPQRFEQNLDRAHAALDTAAELGATNGLVTAGPRGDRRWDDAAQDHVEALQAILPAARERGVRLCLEPLHPVRAQWTFVNTLRDGVELARRLDGVGVVLDFWHHWWERDLDETIRTHVDRMGLVHVSDYKLETLTLPDRALLGEGVAPITHLLAELGDAGYHGWYEIEVVGPDLDRMGYEAGLPLLLERYEQLRPVERPVRSSRP